jgi:cytochrome c peroxidase
VYYSSFSNYYSPFDNAMNENKHINTYCEKGFNIFMSKAQCATCHFVPQFNGVKPPYIGTEFEVLGVPADTGFSKISPDSGRAIINPATQTMHAFRTGSIRNAEHTKPYMHNGVFNRLEEVISFYDAGGGTGKGLKLHNQTLSTDSLKLSNDEKEQLTAFLQSLNENIKFEAPPIALPVSKDKNLNNRKVGGEY